MRESEVWEWEGRGGRGGESERAGEGRRRRGIGKAEEGRGDERQGVRTVKMIRGKEGRKGEVGVRRSRRRSKRMKKKSKRKKEQCDTKRDEGAGLKGVGSWSSRLHGGHLLQRVGDKRDERKSVKKESELGRRDKMKQEDGKDMRGY